MEMGKQRTGNKPLKTINGYYQLIHTYKGTVNGERRGNE